MDSDPQIQVVDFGSQYTQLIIRRLRECGYFAKLYNPEELKSELSLVRAPELSALYTD